MVWRERAGTGKRIGGERFPRANRDAGIGGATPIVDGIAKLNRAASRSCRDVKGGRIAKAG